MKQRDVLNKKIIAISSPFIAIAALLYVLPMIMTVYYSMEEGRFSSGLVFFDNYTRAWQNSYYRLALKNTVVIVLLTISISVVFSMGIAHLMYSNQKLSFIGVPCLLLPMFIPSGAVAHIWRDIFQTSAFTTSLISYLAIVSMFVWKYAGASSVVMYYGLIRIEPETIEAASLDGVSMLARYWLVELPMIKRYIFMALILLTMYSFRLYKESYLLFGEYPNAEMYMLQHYMSNHFTKMSYPNVAVGAISLCVIMLLFCITVFISQRVDGENELI